MIFETKLFCLYLLISSPPQALYSFHLQHFFLSHHQTQSKTHRLPNQTSLKLWYLLERVTFLSLEKEVANNGDLTLNLEVLLHLVLGHFKLLLLLHPAWLAVCSCELWSN